MSIKENIFERFWQIDSRSLIYYNSNRIRIYFDDLNDLEEIQNKSFKLFESIFSQNALHSMVILYSETDTLWNDQIEAISYRELNEIVLSEEKWIIKNENQFEIVFYNKIDFSLLKKLNKAIIEKDFSIDPELYLKVFYFDFENNVIVNFYDDRGMDIVSDNIEKLNEIYNLFKDRYVIKFEKILHN